MVDDALTIGCGKTFEKDFIHKGKKDIRVCICVPEELCSECYRVKEALALRDKEILEKIDEMLDKRMSSALSRSLHKDERYLTVQQFYRAIRHELCDIKTDLKQIISPNVHSSEKPRGRVSSRQGDEITDRRDGKSPTNNPEDTLCECGKPKSEHSKRGGQLWCSNLSDDFNRFTPIADEEDKTDIDIFQENSSRLFRAIRDEGVKG